MPFLWEESIRLPSEMHIKVISPEGECNTCLERNVAEVAAETSLAEQNRHHLIPLNASRRVHEIL